MQSITLEQLKALRKQAIPIKAEIPLKNNALTLWPYISDHDFLNKEIGLAAVDYTFEPEAKGGSLIYGKSQILGFWKMNYLELPAQWLPPKYFEVERIFDKGILRYMRFEKRIEELETGGCLLTAYFYYVPRYAFVPVKKSIQKILHKMFQVITEVDTNLPARCQRHIEGFFQKTPSLKQNITHLHQTWAHLMPDSVIPEKVAEFIYTAPDRYVYKLRPFEVADYFELSRQEVLTFCLLAAKQGFLDLSWDVLCPSCRGPNEQTSQLWQLHSQVHCDACNIQYDANFDQNVEVTFSPPKIIRQVDSKLYCLANPAMTPHIWAQITLDPHETREVDLQFLMGSYRLSSLSLPDQITVIVSKQATSQHQTIYLDERFLTLKNREFALKTTLTLHNPTERWITLKIENLNYQERVATAAFVTSLQDFRDLFSASQVLRPNMQMGLSNIVILFSDLVGSTRLYEQKGDGDAFALVQKHFEIMIPIIRQHQGGIVKTIGDAVMAVFTDSQAALKASLDILQAFAQHNQAVSADEEIIIKLGLHQGPCIVLNLNDKLDYFGNTVNLAARIQGMSQGNDVLISETFFQDIQPQLAQYPNLKISSYVAELKGVQNKNTLYRLYFSNDSND
jgi:adenylate cyclase